MHKIFKILNQIISSYSSRPITPSSLDSYLTIQIITECLLDIGELELTKGEAALVRKVVGKNNWKKNVEGMDYGKDGNCVTGMRNFEDRINQYQKSVQQADISKIQHYNNTHKIKPPKSPTPNLSQFTILIIHEHNFTPSLIPTNQTHINLLTNIDNIIIINTNGHAINNILYHDLNKSTPTRIIELEQRVLDGRYLLVVVVNQGKTQPKFGERRERERYFYEELERYCSICDIFHGHINLRICAYSESKSLLNYQHDTKQKLKHFILTALQFTNSQDDLDVFLRQQIPNDAYIRTILQRGNRVRYQDIHQSIQYKLIRYKQWEYYSFKVQQYQSQQNVSDVFLIWVLVDGMPLLQLLPLFNQGRKRGKGSRKGKYTQKRSLLGYSIIEMEDKICEKTKQKKEIQQISYENGNGFNAQLEEVESNSIYTCNSQDQLQAVLQNQPLGSSSGSNPINIYIINIIDKSLSEQSIDSLIGSSLKDTLEFCIKERKQLYENLQISKNMALISKISNILEIDEKDLYHVLYLNKL